MATSAVAYFTSIWNNERGVIPVLFILCAFLAILVGLGFGIYHCSISGRGQADLEPDLEKTTASKESSTQATPPPAYLYDYTSRAQDPGDRDIPPQSSQHHLPTYHHVCECELIYGPCHTTPTPTRVQNKHIVDMYHPRSLRPPSPSPQDPPAYEELMAFGRARLA